VLHLRQVVVVVHIAACGAPAWRTRSINDDNDDEDEEDEDDNDKEGEEDKEEEEDKGTITTSLERPRAIRGGAGGKTKE